MGNEPVKETTEDVIQLKIDSMLQETKSHGTKVFPFQYYDITFDWKQRDYVEWHWHKELEFLILESEAMVCRIGEQTLQLKKGDRILINSSVVHRYEAPEKSSSEKGRWISLLFSTDMIASPRSIIYEKNILPVLQSGVYYFDFRQDDMWKIRINRIVEEICSICCEKCATQELSIHIALCSIWKELSEHLTELEQSKTVNKNLMLQARLRVMLQYIWENFAQPIKLEDIARAANISVSMAQRCFRVCIHDSPNHYLQLYRLDHAKRLLLTTNLSILDIALTSGFGSVGYFDYLFKREFGRTPKQFVKQQYQ
ncbi:MAG: AraC family transcriptional regulator [Eubacteriales bacterium]|nr:AraC family transcriptional regulator [Eubacteriales bacterium]